MMRASPRTAPILVVHRGGAARECAFPDMSGQRRRDGHSRRRSGRIAFCGRVDALRVIVFSAREDYVRFFSSCAEAAARLDQVMAQKKHLDRGWQQQTVAAGSGPDPQGPYSPRGSRGVRTTRPSSSAAVSSALIGSESHLQLRRGCRLFRQRGGASSRTRRVRCSGSRSPATASMSASTSLPHGSPLAATCSS